MADHWNADRTKNAGEGGHPIMRWADKVSAALRNAIVAGAAGIGGVVWQSGDTVPGFYLWDSAAWNRLQGGDPPVVTPPLLTAHASSYQPVSAEAWRYGMIFRITSDASYEIRSLATLTSPPYGIRYLVNANTIASGFNLTLMHLLGGEPAADQIQIAGAANLVVPPGGVATVWEDAATGKWRVM